MSTVMTNTEFVKKLKDVAQNYKTLYIMGCFGAPMNDTNKARYCKNHSYNKDADRTAMIKAASDDTFGFDCVCLIKGILWGWNGDKSRIYGGAEYAINGVPDIGADTMITKCYSVSTDFNKIEVGEAVWMSGHIGIYIGDGLAVECTPSWENKVQITACNCSKTGYHRRNWTKHGKLPYIKYETGSNQSTVLPAGIQGIDVSKWQGYIDWSKVKSDGIKFAMIRLGYGSKDGNSCGLDGYFEKNVDNAIKAGIDIGCYFYSYATSVEAAKKEAQYVVDVLSKYKGVFTYPVALDIEDNSQVNLGKTTLTNMVTTFGDIVEKSGFWFSVYSSLSWFNNYLDDTKIKRFDHWLAQWSPSPTYNGEFGIWQNSATGKINGIVGNVDTNIAYKDYPTIIKSSNLNGFTSAIQKPTNSATPTTNLKFKKSDVVNFTGGKHYASADASSGSSVKPSKAIITDTYNNGKHPYHCRAVNDAGEFIDGVYGWVDESTLSVIVSNSDNSSAKIEKGSLVKIIGSKYYHGTNIPSWVKAMNWYVKEVVGERAVIDKSEDGKSAICSPIKVTDIALVNTSTPESTKSWTPAVGEIVNYNGTLHYANANTSSGAYCKGGKAKITQIYQLGKSKHPYHLIAVSGGGSSVYGWVDEGTFTKA